MMKVSNITYCALFVLASQGCSVERQISNQALDMRAGGSITAPEAICTAMNVYAKEFWNEMSITAQARFTGQEWIVTFDKGEPGFTPYTVMLSPDGKVVGFDP